MASREYNGFTIAERGRGGRWYRKQVAQGLRAKPLECSACGQREGIIDAHSEDYSEPFGDHIGKYALCYVCHLMLHCRHHDAARWRAYRRMLHKGARPIAFETRNFPRLSAMYLKGYMLPTSFTWHGEREHCALDDIPDEQRNLAQERQGNLLDGCEA